MLPEGVMQADFDNAIGELRDALSPNAVIVQDDARYTSYTDAYTPRQLEDNAPSAAVAPLDIEQIQRVLAIARKWKIPLWTVSTGRNFGYGGPAPRKAGCIVLDRKRMNRSIEVNEKHAYAVVEPGVTYQELYR